MACRQDNYCKSHFHRDDLARCNEAIRVVTHAIIGSERLRYNTKSPLYAIRCATADAHHERHSMPLTTMQNMNVLVCT